MEWITKKLTERKKKSAERTLKSEDLSIDFSSNNYLGYANYHSIPEISVQFQYLLKNGSTGSRLLSGNSPLAEKLEHEMGSFFNSHSATFYTSGYTANVGLWQCLGTKNDTYILDELIHASIIDGVRLSHAKRLKFKHNNLDDLAQKLEKASGNIFVGIESVYSMDGDFAPLEEIAELCLKHQAHLIVDEAHAAGIYGPNGQGLVVANELENLVFSRVVTFGKAFGAHGAAVLGSSDLKRYLINFSRAFIYSTAPAPVQLAAVSHAMQWVNQAHIPRKKLAENIAHFQALVKKSTKTFLSSSSAIQGVVIPGNQSVKALALELQNAQINVFPILSPTVAEGSERIRICLHAHNTIQQIDTLIELINAH